MLAGVKLAGAGADNQPQAALSDLPLALTGAPQCMAEGRVMDRHSAEVVCIPPLCEHAAFVCWCGLPTSSA